MKIERLDGADDDKEDDAALDAAGLEDGDDLGKCSRPDPHTFLNRPLVGRACANACTKRCCGGRMSRF